jgi:hypothetical protein
MTEEKKGFGGREVETTSTATRVDTGRRKVMTAAALLVPAIATLHATPAWAETDYTMTAYRYGTNAGRCRNPNFNPNANPNSTAGQEFIDCPMYDGSTHEVIGGDGQDPGPIGF